MNCQAPQCPIFPRWLCQSHNTKYCDAHYQIHHQECGTPVTPFFHKGMDQIINLDRKCEETQNKFYEIVNSIFSTIQHSAQNIMDSIIQKRLAILELIDQDQDPQMINDLIESLSFPVTEGTNNFARIQELEHKVASYDINSAIEEIKEEYEAYHQEKQAEEDRMRYDYIEKINHPGENPAFTQLDSELVRKTDKKLYSIENPAFIVNVYQSFLRGGDNQEYEVAVKVYRPLTNPANYSKITQEITILQYLQQNQIPDRCFLTFFGVYYEDNEVNIVLEPHQNNLITNISHLRALSFDFPEEKIFQLYSSLLNSYTQLTQLKIYDDHTKIYHCDTKPQNYYVDEKWNIKVIDLSDSIVSINNDSTVIDLYPIGGTEGYRSPEDEEGVKLNLKKRVFELERSGVFILGMLMLQIVSKRDLKGFNSLDKRKELDEIIDSLDWIWARNLFTNMLNIAPKKRSTFAKLISYLAKVKRKENAVLPPEVSEKKKDHYQEIAQNSNQIDLSNKVITAENLLEEFKTNSSLVKVTENISSNGEVFNITEYTPLDESKFSKDVANEILIEESIKSTSNDRRNFVEYIGVTISQGMIRKITSNYKRNFLQILRELNQFQLTQEFITPIILSLINSYLMMKEKNIFHCDINPQNFYVDSEYYIKPIDFSRSIILRSTGDIKYYSIRSTKGYRSPEDEEGVIHSKKNTIVQLEKSDIFALGLMILMFLTMRDLRDFNTQEKNPELIEMVYVLPWQWIVDLLLLMLQVDPLNRASFSTVKKITKKMQFDQDHGYQSDRASQNSFTDKRNHPNINPQINPPISTGGVGRIKTLIHTSKTVTFKIKIMKTTYKNIYCKENQVAVKKYIPRIPNPDYLTITNQIQIFEILGSQAGPDNCFIPYEGAYWKKNKVSLVMKYYPKNLMTTILSLQNTSFKFSESLISQIFIKIIKSFVKMKELNIYHCDIKLENFLIDDKWDIRIIGFSYSIRFTMNNASELFPTRGTRGYRSPEDEEGATLKRVRSLFDVEKSEIFTLGLLMLQLYTTRDLKGYNTRARNSELMAIVNSLPWQWMINLFKKLLHISPQKRFTFEELDSFRCEVIEKRDPNYGMKRPPETDNEKFTRLNHPIHNPEIKNINSLMIRKTEIEIRHYEIQNFEVTVYIAYYTNDFNEEIKVVVTHYRQTTYIADYIGITQEIEIYQKLGEHSSSSNCFLQYYGTYYECFDVYLIQEYYEGSIMQEINCDYNEPYEIDEDLLLTLLRMLLESIEILKQLNILLNSIMAEMFTFNKDLCRLKFTRTKPSNFTINENKSDEARNKSEKSNLADGGNAILQVVTNTSLSNLPSEHQNKQLKRMADSVKGECAKRMIDLIVNPSPNKKNNSTSNLMDEMDFIKYHPDFNLGIGKRGKKDNIIEIYQPKLSSEKSENFLIETKKALYNLNGQNIETTLKGFKKRPDLGKAIDYSEIYNDITIYTKLNEYTSTNSCFLKYYEYCYDSEYIYLVMEYLPFNLKDNIAENKVDELRYSIASKLLDSFTWLSSENIYCCDIRPENFIMDKQWNIKLSCSAPLIDFKNFKQEKLYPNSARHYRAPEDEIFINEQKKKSEFELEKSEIFTLGLLILQIFVKEELKRYNKYNKQEKLSKKMNSLENLWEFELILLMLNFDPQKRLSFEKLSYYINYGYLIKPKPKVLASPKNEISYKSVRKIEPQRYFTKTNTFEVYFYTADYFDGNTNHQVSVKMYRLLNKDNDIKAMINDEIETYKKLSVYSDDEHCFLMYYGTFIYNKDINLVMEYHDSTLLYKIASEKSIVTEEKALPIFKRLLNSFAKMQELGICHGRINFWNIIVKNEWEMRIIDFQYSIIHFSTLFYYSSDSYFQASSENFVAPEVQDRRDLAEKSIDRLEKSEVFSLGLLFLSILNKDTNFDLNSAAQNPALIAKVNNLQCGYRITVLLNNMLNLNPMYRRTFAELRDSLPT